MAGHITLVSHINGAHKAAKVVQMSDQHCSEGLALCDDVMHVVCAYLDWCSLNSFGQACWRLRTLCTNRLHGALDFHGGTARWRTELCRIGRRMVALVDGWGMVPRAPTTESSALCFLRPVSRRFQQCSHLGPKCSLRVSDKGHVSVAIACFDLCIVRYGTPTNFRVPLGHCKPVAAVYVQPFTVASSIFLAVLATALGGHHVLVVVMLQLRRRGPVSHCTIVDASRDAYWRGEPQCVRVTVPAQVNPFQRLQHDIEQLCNELLPMQDDRTGKERQRHKMVQLPGDFRGPLQPFR